MRSTALEVFRLRNSPKTFQFMIFTIRMFKSIINIIQNFYQIIMDPEPQQDTFRFLVIGRMGDGKSSVCKFLTGNQGIQVSSKIQSCTHHCKMYSSSDKLNEQRGYKIQVLDTPGLDSQEENMLNIIIELADIFNKCQYINGILYVISMAHNRDETISWFLNFLRIYFTKEQLSKIIIPILTHYDKIIFEDDEKVMEAKNSRKNGIIKFWDNGNEEVINFWENHIEWINDAKQKQALQNNPDFQNIYWNQLQKLIERGRMNQMLLVANAKSFETNLLNLLTEKIEQAEGNYKVQSQQVPPFSFKINLEKISFVKSLKEMKSTFSKILIGTTVFLGLKGYASKKYKTYRKSMEEVQIGLMEQISTGINKIIAAKFMIEFYEWISISTSTKDVVEDLNRIFSIGGMCHIHITLPKNTFFGVDKLELRRTVPDSKQPCVLLEKQKNNTITFQDCRRFTDETERDYEFFNIKILRPSNEFLEEAIKKIVRSK